MCAMLNYNHRLNIKRLQNSLRLIREQWDMGDKDKEG